MPGGPRWKAFVAGRPSLPGGPCREALAERPQALAAGRPFSGGHILEKGPPRDRPRRCSKSFILWQNLTWQYPASISRIQVCLTSRPSLPGCPRCRLVAGRPSLPGGPRCREALVAPGRASLPGGPRCREALVAGRPSLLGDSRCRAFSWPFSGPRCREALVAGRPSLLGDPRCRAFSWPFPGLFLASSGPLPASSGPLPGLFWPLPGLFLASSWLLKTSEPLLPY